MSKAGWSTLSSRRHLLAAGGVSLLAGCGFRPMYGPAGGADASLPADLRRELAAVRMDYVGERAGVLTRRALERRFESAGGGETVPAKYLLQLSTSYGTEVLAYRRDGAISRVRYVGTTSWVLLSRDTPPREIARNLVRTMDAFNVPDYQFFSAEIARDNMERRLVDEQVEQVFLGVSSALRQHLRGGATG